VAAAPQVVLTAPAPPIVAGPQAIVEKSASQAALERGNVGASIAAGERSVALDPTDAESWLILGAAYQQQGNDHDARRCFVACMRNANRGPKRECAAMLR
jgi:Flp pilus assembly protein TadD